MAVVGRYAKLVLFRTWGTGVGCAGEFEQVVADAADEVLPPIIAVLVTDGGGDILDVRRRHYGCRWRRKFGGWWAKGRLLVVVNCYIDKMS